LSPRSSPRRLAQARTRQRLRRLSEGDQLRTQRESLRAERKELLTELGKAADESEEAAAEDHCAGDQELEGRFLAAVEEASRENASLEAEIKGLRDDNSRLKSKGAAAAKAEAEAIKTAETQAINTDSYKAADVEPLKPVAAKPGARVPRSFPKASDAIKKAPPAVEEDMSFQQREAMASLLRKSQGVTSPSTARSGMTARGFSQGKGKKNELDKGQEDQLKGALHMLFKNFAK